MFTMTYNEAMTIQRAQMVWYRQAIGRKGIKAIRARTRPCPGNPDEPMRVSDINALVPRGGSFETYICRIPWTRDETTLAWHDAIRRGLL